MPTPNAPTQTNTGQGVIDSARTRLQDYSDQSYSDDDLTVYVYSAIRDFSQSGCCQAKLTYAATAASSVGFSTLDATNDILTILRVDIGANNIPLSEARVDEDLAWPDDSSGDPEGWMQWADTLYLHRSYTGNVNVFYTYTPPNPSAITDPTGIPSRWFDGLVAYVCYRALLSSEDGQSQVLLGEYTALKQQAAVLTGVRLDGTRVPA